MKAVRYFLGLDLGQANEFTALAVLERAKVWPNAPRHERRPAYALRHLKRFALDTPYPEMFHSVRALLQTNPMPGAFVVVDKTGVGNAVVRMLQDSLEKQVTCLFCAIIMTDGQAVVHQDDVGWCIPKKEMVGVLQVLLQTRRLQMPRDLAEVNLLISELENFKMRVTLARTDNSLEAWREGQHDDLVFAVAIAAWMGEQGLPPLYDSPEE